MLDSKTLSKSLASLVGIGERKQANAMTVLDELPVVSVKLQEIIGDPDTTQLSWSSQTKPSTGDVLTNDPNSPLEGDEVFWSGLFDGARFQDKNGAWWDIANYDWEGAVTIQNVFYPRIQAVVNVQSIRRAIHSWIEPFLQRVPPPPANIDYGIVETRNIG